MPPPPPFLTCGSVCMPLMWADPAPEPPPAPFMTPPPLDMEAVEMMLPVVDMLSSTWSAAAPAAPSRLLLPAPLEVSSQN